MLFNCFRRLALAPKRAAQGDNVESVDMEMSSDEETETETAKPLSTVSFSLASHNKLLVDSPLVEKEVQVKKRLSAVIPPPGKQLLANPSPPKELLSADIRLPEPPPLPDVNDIFPELDSSGESDTSPSKVPSPPCPPPPPMPIQPIQTVHDVPVLSPGYLHNQNPRGFYNARFNNQRQRFPAWQNNANNIRPRQAPQSGQRFRGDANFRGRPFFRGNRPPRFPQW